MLSNPYPSSVLIFGGAGALGSVLTQRLLDRNFCVCVCSRDEAKHFQLRNKIDPSLHRRLETRVVDVRDYSAVEDAMMSVYPDIVINCAALKQVPLCEDNILEAVKTNVLGTENIAKAIRVWQLRTPYISISTDKAVKPINAYGYTKALQEKITLRNVEQSCVVRYGNVLESTGSVIPFFKALLKQKKQIPLTDPHMTRFLLSLDDAVNLIFKAMELCEDSLKHNKETLIPDLRSAKIETLAEVLCEYYDLDPHEYIKMTEIRPGEKLHEILVAEHEIEHIEKHDDYFSITPDRIACGDIHEQNFSSEFSGYLLDKRALTQFLIAKGVLECASQSRVRQVS